MSMSFSTKINISYINDINFIIEKFNKINCNCIKLTLSDHLILSLSFSGVTSNQDYYTSLFIFREIVCKYSVPIYDDILGFYGEFVFLISADNESFDIEKIKNWLVNDLKEEGIKLNSDMISFYKPLNKEKFSLFSYKNKCKKNALKFFK